MLLDSLSLSLKTCPGTEDVSLMDAAQAAVAVLVRPNLDVLFIRRSEHHGDPWSGHIALPGGRLDGSESALSAAKREVLEEVGVGLGEARLLGMLNQVASPDLAPRVLVSPFVFALPDNPQLNPDPSEVAGTYWFGLERLLSGEGRGSFEYEYRQQRFELPRIDLDGARIWGMTLRIVDDLVDRLHARP